MSKEVSDRNDLDKLTDKQLVDMRDRIQKEIREINKEIASRLMSRDQQSK